jgi:cytochrome c-type biogenesis protein
MDLLLQGFWLGNGAILTNVCLLPLYPGLIAFLAGNAQNERAQRAGGWLGLLVLAGVLTLMLAIGLLLHLLGSVLSFNTLLPVLLPVIYTVVIVLGVLMLLGKNPFARLATAQSPVLQNPYLSAYVYGLLLGPMTLPCTGPIVLSAFTLGALSGAGELANQLLFFLAFGVGFGWPLVVLPLIARGAQRSLTGWLTRHHLLLTRISGVLLIAIGVYGFGVEVFKLG